MIFICACCGEPLDTTYDSYQMSPDFPGMRFCWTLAGDRDNCLERMKSRELAKEEEVCSEGLHIEYSGDTCPRCGQEIKQNWERGN